MLTVLSQTHVFIVLGATDSLSKLAQVTATRYARPLIVYPSVAADLNLKVCEGQNSEFGETIFQLLTFNGTLLQNARPALPALCLIWVITVGSNTGTTLVLDELQCLFPLSTKIGGVHHLLPDSTNLWA